MSRLNLTIGISACVLFAGLSSVAVAQDRLRIAAGLAGTWENSFSELGQNAGFFKKHGLVLDIFYTQGAGETQQAVISGSADIGTGVGTFNTFGAFSKGAPIRVIAATHTGANDLTWYVRATRPSRPRRTWPAGASPTRLPGRPPMRPCSGFSGYSGSASPRWPPAALPPR